jgi:hypothetical protein
MELQQVRGSTPAAAPQPATLEHTTGLLDLPCVILCMIWQQLVLEDRKSLYCTARALRTCIGGCPLPCMVYLCHLHGVAASIRLSLWPAGPWLQRSMRC